MQKCSQITADIYRNFILKFLMFEETLQDPQACTACLMLQSMAQICLGDLMEVFMG